MDDQNGKHKVTGKVRASGLLPKVLRSRTASKAAKTRRIALTQVRSKGGAK